MKTQQKRRIKRHPLIRFIRGVVRLFRVLFGPRKQRVIPPPSAIDRAEIERERMLEQQRQELAERYITVGELLARVQWQAEPESELATATTSTAVATQLAPPTFDVSRN